MVSSFAHADKVKMAFGDSLPPFIFPTDQTGIELDIVREALAYNNHTLEPVFVPMERLVQTYKEKSTDAIMMDVGDRSLKKFGCYSKAPVLYKNVFITLKKQNINIKSPQHLKGLKINSFIGAAKRYPDWLSKVYSDGTYFEDGNQSLQILQLVNGRIDSVLSDIDIFKYYFLKSNLKNISFSDFETFDVLTENPLEYRPVFRSKKICRDFDEGLAKLKKTDRIKKIYQQYLGNL